MDFKEFTEEQKAKIQACKTTEEILALAKEEGYDLSDEQLEAVAGGGRWSDGTCYHCPNDSYAKCGMHGVS